MSWFAALARGGDVAAERKTMGFATGDGTPAPGGLPTLDGARSGTGLRIDQATAMAVSAVHRCTSIRALDVARCPPAVVRLDGNGNSVTVRDHELSALFRRPNQVQSWFEFAEQMHAAWVLRGNTYAVKIRDRRGAVTKLIPVNPDFVTVLEAPDGSIFYDVSRSGMWIMAQLDGMPIAIPAEDVLHVRDLSANTLTGLSRLFLAREAVGLALGQEKQAARWIGNGARPSGVLQSDKKISAEGAKRLKVQWQTFMGGLGNTGTTAVLEEGLKWAPMQLSSVDLEFIQSRQMQVREIARWFDVPLHKLYEADSMSRASVAELNADYVQTTVVGDLTRWERRLEHDWDLLDEGLSVSFDERALLRADILTMRNVARLGVMSGLIEPNEGRAEIGYGPRPDGSGLRSPTNQAPNGSAVDGVAPDGAGRPSGGELPGDKT